MGAPGDVENGMGSINNERQIRRSEALPARVLAGERLNQSRIRRISEADAQGDMLPVADMIPKNSAGDEFALVVGVEGVVDEIVEHVGLLADNGSVDGDGAALCGAWFPSEHEAGVEVGFLQGLLRCQKCRQRHRGHVH